MQKIKENKRTKRIDKGKIVVRIVSLILALLMVLGFAATLIYYIVNK